MGTRKFSLVWESSWLWTSSWSEATLISPCLFPCGGRSSPGQTFPSQVRKMGIHVCLNVFYFLLCHINLPTFCKFNPRCGGIAVRWYYTHYCDTFILSYWKWEHAYLNILVFLTLPYVNFKKIFFSHFLKTNLIEIKLWSTQAFLIGPDRLRRAGYDFLWCNCWEIPRVDFYRNAK